MDKRELVLKALDREGKRRVKPRDSSFFSRVLVIAVTTIGITVLHWVTPAGPHTWHWTHLVAQQLYFLPLLLGAFWFPPRGSALTTLAVSLFYLTHIFRDWQGYPMVQADQTASLASFWFISLISSWAFGRVRTAMEEIRSAHQDTLTALASSLELRERETAGHSERVRAYTLLLAEQMGIRNPETLDQMAAGALFHDIGKIGIKDDVLLKEGPLEPLEQDAMRKHPEMGAALLGRVHSLAGTRDLVLSHHERYDGSGYPRGLRGNEIPLGARIFAVADSFDAITSHRPYQGARTFDEAVRSIRRGRGTLYDPEVVDAFLSISLERWRQAAEQHGGTLQ